MNALLVRFGTFMFRYRTLVLPVVLLALVFGLRPHFPNGSPAQDRILDAVGIAVALAGQGLRAAVIGFAYIRRGGVDGKVHADQLVTGGLFGHCRNPLYVGNILILIGLLIVFNNPWAYLIGVPFVLLVYVGIVAAEEDFLRPKFGAAYDDYTRRVNRWVPDFRGLEATLSGMEFDWRRLIIKEYGSAYAWTAFAVILLAREALLDAGPAERRPVLTGLGIVFVLLTLGWGTARYLKKKRLIRPRRDPVKA